jgi:hypothetical protein
MEKSQTVQQPSAENAKSEPKTSSNNPLIYLLFNYPWLFVIALLAIFAGGAALSLHSLGNVEPAEQTKAQEQQPSLNQPLQATNTTTENSNSTPLWTLAAIALSCASGSLIILRLLNQPTSHQKAYKPTNRYQVRTTKQRQTTAHQELSYRQNQKPRLPEKQSP